MQDKTSSVQGKVFAYLELYENDARISWREICGRCRKIGFDYLVMPPPFSGGAGNNPFLPGDLRIAHPVLVGLAENARTSRTVDVVEALCRACRDDDLRVIFDIVIDRADSEGILVSEHREFFDDARSEFLNPRSLRATAGAAAARFDHPELLKRLIALWAGCLGALLTVGVDGFRFLNPGAVTAEAWRLLNATLRNAFPHMISLAYTPGMSWQAISHLHDCGFDSVFSSLPWWDLSAGWLLDEFQILRRVGRVITMPCALPPTGRTNESANGPALLQKLNVAVAIGDSLLVPVDPCIFAITGPAQAENDMRAAIARFAHIQSCGTQTEMHALSSGGNAVTALTHDSVPDQTGAGAALVTFINRDLSRCEEIDVPTGLFNTLPGTAVGGFSRIGGDKNPLSPLQPGEVRVVKVERVASPVFSPKPTHETRESLERAITAPRIVIEAVAPAVEDGSFAARYVIGEFVEVAADIFCDGHPVIAAELRWQRVGDENWQSASLKAGHNDRWYGAFRPDHVGLHYFVFETWIDEFASVLHDIEAKQNASIDIALDLSEARLLLKSAAAGADPSLRTKLAALTDRLAGASPTDALALLTHDDTRSTMRAAQPRRFLSRSRPIPIEVERQKAAFASWYELFPRSTAPISGRHGTFDDVHARLPEIQAMGFDVLYLPPIHPIGQTNRKGRNNSLTATPDDPGSPYAIGAAEGGHDALHSDLGSFDDFARLIAAASKHGLEMALDFAVQCSPDHPWLKNNPEWFRWRADGSLRFAENPPKKYEDIVNVDFYAAEGAAELWMALRDVVLFWIDKGVKIFRVDNPHTKPLPFWQWFIAEIRAQHPDVIFLSEAFTRPKMMYRLAKIGFSQSYTYFTWRNSKQEIADYFTELTTAPVVDFFRPHLFVNTPDINPFFLQDSGRAGFLIRAVLAATLSGLWGMYSGFELCESAGLPGREEYLDSEKYEIKLRDFDAPGNIKEEISVLNRIRKSQTALHIHRGLKFYNAFNDNIIAYGKMSPARKEMIFVAVNLDPHHIQDADFEMPLWEWRLPDHESLRVDDLLHSGKTFVWTGKLQHVRLDPSVLPYAIWRFAPLSEGGV